MPAQVHSLPILYLITSTNVGGSERALYELISRIDRHRFAVHVCSLKRPGAFAGRISRAADGFYTLGLPEAGGIRAVLNFLPAGIRLLVLLRRLRPVIVHAFLFRANILGRIAGRLAGVPVIISSVRVLEADKYYKHLIDCWTSFLADRYIAVSEAIRQFTIERVRLAPEKVVTIYNGIEPLRAASVDPEKRPQNQAVRLALVGRFDRQKGHAVFLQALKSIVPREPRVRAFFCGEGPDKARIETMVAAEGLREHVAFMGIVDDIFTFLATVDIVVLPSLWEGLPNVLLEAMAVARPVVASRIAGIDEVVVDGETGILCTPGDPQELAAALFRLISDRPLAEAMGRSGQVRVQEKFGIEVTVQKTVALYQQLLLAKRALA